MYHVKVMKDGKSRLHPPADYISVATFREQSPIVERGDATPGVVIELLNNSRTEGEPAARRFVRLPEDGDIAYIMNDAGQTVDSHRWPLREEAVSRAGGAQ